jgi:hypothetical protein
LHFPLNVIRGSNAGRRDAGRFGKITAYKILTGKPEGKKPLSRHRRRWNNVRRKYKVVLLPRHHASKKYMEVEVKTSSASCEVKWSTLAPLPWE